MIKFYSLLLIVIIISVKCYAIEPSTPDVVSTYYRSMELLSNETSASRAFDLQVEMQRCFMHSVKSSGVRIPNDFYILEHSGNETMNSNLYTMELKKRLFDDGNRRLKVRVDIKKSVYGQEVNLQKFQSEDKVSILTFVTKTYSYGSTNITITDTVSTIDNLIYAVTNGTGHDDKNDDTESLRAMAAQYYSVGLHKKAFQIYEKILSIDPCNANAYYRMGILAFWYGKKCGFKKKEYHAKGREYMEKALYFGYNHDTVKTVKYYMDHLSAI